MKRRGVTTRETPILRRQTGNAAAKQRIGQAAARLIGGSTGLAVAHERHRHEHLTVVTDFFADCG
jgi:DeoR/GlpR family transcriptional regulator of sugar metabolism